MAVATDEMAPRSIRKPPASTTGVPRLTVSAAFSGKRCTCGNWSEAWITFQMTMGIGAVCVPGMECPPQLRKRRGVPAGVLPDVTSGFIARERGDFQLFGFGAEGFLSVLDHGVG